MQDFKSAIKSFSASFFAAFEPRPRGGDGLWLLWGEAAADVFKNRVVGRLLGWCERKRCGSLVIGVRNRFWMKNGGTLTVKAGKLSHQIGAHFHILFVGQGSFVTFIPAITFYYLFRFLVWRFLFGLIPCWFPKKS